MKHLCRKCNKQIPTRLLNIDGSIKLRCNRRKYCFDCIPHGKRQLNPIDKNKKFLCVTCNKEYFYSRTSGCSTKLCSTCLSNRGRKRKKEKAINYKGGCCQNCGYKKCLAALQFHHVDKTNKKYNLSCIYNYSWKIWKEELNKCILLCANCHAELEYS